MAEPLTGLTGQSATPIGQAKLAIGTTNAAITATLANDRSMKRLSEIMGRH